MSHNRFRSIRRYILIATTTFVAVCLSSMMSLRAHEQATCCTDPCTTTTGGVSCGCHPICNTETMHNVIYYFNPDCKQFGDSDNCARGNCYMFDLYDAQGKCTVQCCTDDWAECY